MNKEEFLKDVKDLTSQCQSLFTNCENFNNKWLPNHEELKTLIKEDSEMAAACSALEESFETLGDLQ